MKPIKKGDFVVSKMNQAETYRVLSIGPTRARVATVTGERLTFACPVAMLRLAPSTMQPRLENERLRALLADCSDALDDGTHGRLLIRVRAALGGDRPGSDGRPTNQRQQNRKGDDA